MTTLSQVKQPTLAMSTPTPRRIICGAVAVRPAEETRAELERACLQDREVLATPIPQPASGAPFKFFVVRRPPLPAPPPLHPRADEGPAASTAERNAAAAGIAAAVGEETEATIRPLLRIAATATSATPRSAAPEETDDPYNLRRWRRWSVRWDE